MRITRVAAVLLPVAVLAGCGGPEGSATDRETCASIANKDADIAYELAHADEDAVSATRRLIEGWNPTNAGLEAATDRMATQLGYWLQVELEPSPDTHEVDQISYVIRDAQRTTMLHLYLDHERDAQDVCQDLG